MKPVRALLIGSVLAISCLAVAAPKEIGPGSKAPNLAVKTWYKGTPVKKLDKGIFVVEFWATWCGPCVQSIPHVTELAKKNTDVTFIGVSIWEDDKGGIKQFIDKMGDKMDYNVGYAGNQDGMAATWMKPAAQNGIPAAFVIKDGVIEWIGHPMDMEKPLSEIKTGKFDRKAFKESFDKEAAKARNEAAIQTELGEIEKLHEAGKKDDANKRLKALEQKYPQAAASVRMMRFGWLATDDAAAWEKQVAELGAKKDPESYALLCQFCIRNVSGAPSKVAQGTLAIETALTSSEWKDMMVLQYAAYFYSETKNIAKALQANEALLAILPAGKDFDEYRAEIKKTIEELKAKKS